jgi:hypothetical protein
MLRRERVFERDIFRFGTGTVIVLNLKRPIGFNQPGYFNGRKYRLFLDIAQITAGVDAGVAAGIAAQI